MLSPEDMTALGVEEGDTVSVIRKVTWTEKITKGAKDITGKIIPKKGDK